jgi:hypothetical protein
MPSLHDIINSVIAIFTLGSLVVLFCTIWLSIQYPSNMAYTIKNRRYLGLLVSSTLIFFLGSIYLAKYSY